MLKRTQKEFETIIINLFGRDFLCEETHYVNNATKVTLCCPSCDGYFGILDKDKNEIIASM